MRARVSTQQTCERIVNRLLLRSGFDIRTMNAVRRRLSAIKGGQLAAAAQGHVLTLAVSDVVGDDLSVIASGVGGERTLPSSAPWRGFSRLSR